MTETTPEAVFTAATTAFSRGDIDGWLARAHDDIVLEFPYAPPGSPTRVEGKQAAGEYLRAVPAQIDFEEVTHLDVHQTVDPDTAIVEWSAKGRIKATGAPYEMAYVVVLTLTDGLMKEYRDYWNPLVLAETLS
ncbi:nuclear transport factor 2 family protein [Mycolicibacterium arenosum]|uniref:Nuclear transport factor 2 family protein n=1 Tax=Mycolicibacterium arenosum TaxID=2952157 RepID=A0ABT1M5Q9_9MYCO|nr:nuclear transport factor 2 family protein [Mycolicibacterium sp. CAU 1645]MCP9274162.1 nuclear transport factor 2 family protein [Mycolicibacterium sp. CAU 1645]